jgi:hypothetical protein
MDYENVGQKVLFGKAVLTALMYGRRYDVITQNGHYSRKSNMCTSVFRNQVSYINASSLQNSILKPPSDATLNKSISRVW